MPLDVEYQLDVSILEPALTLITVPGYQTVWDSPHRTSHGVYLWCIEYQGGFLASYVGKTSDRRGFDGRLRIELNDWRKGRYWLPVDCDAFLAGRRVPILNPDPDCLSRELDALESKCRILLAPLMSDAECVQVESVIVDQLRRHPFTYGFLGNRDKASKYRPKSFPIVRFSSSPRIVGLTAAVE